MRVVSMNSRLAAEDQNSDEIEVALFEITHPDLAAPLRLSTDNAERISTEPLVYGTRSSWRGANPATEPFLWVVASAVIPGDADDAPAAAKIILANLDAEITNLLRSYTDMATVNLAMVLASSPDVIEEQWLGLQLTQAEGDDGQIVISLSREEIELEPFPSGRMIRIKFPGLHR